MNRAFQRRRIVRGFAWLIIAAYTFPGALAFSQSCTIFDPTHDALPGTPQWADIERVTATQEGSSVLLEFQMADSIPLSIQDSCLFQIFLTVDTLTNEAGPLQIVPAKFKIESNLAHYDGGWWHADLLLMGTTEPKSTRARLHDWKLTGSRIRMRFSLITVPWLRIKITAKVFYRDGYADLAPDTGAVEFRVDRNLIPQLKEESAGRVQFVYPANFDSVATKYHVLELTNLAYDIERELTGLRPIGGDSVRFVFDPFIGGAALEGDPITVGPYMWGKNPLWFVYFHEMGHNFCNAAYRFRQMYPLLPFRGLGPLPANLLFYEAFASLPAMYVFDRLSSGQHLDPTAQRDVMTNIRNEWSLTRRRFESAWETYKKNPAFGKLNPDVVDGLLLELQAKYGWMMMSRFYQCLQPASLPLNILGETCQGDTSDLRRTRATFTAALLSAAAGTPLADRFIDWGFPVDPSLFSRTYTAFSDLLQTRQRGGQEVN